MGLSCWRILLEQYMFLPPRISRTTSPNTQGEKFKFLYRSLKVPRRQSVEWGPSIQRDMGAKEYILKWWSDIGGTMNDCIVSMLLPISVIRNDTKRWRSSSVVWWSRETWRHKLKLYWRTTIGSSRASRPSTIYAPLPRVTYFNHSPLLSDISTKVACKVAFFGVG